MTLVNLIFGEFLKLKRNKMLLMSILGALAVPLLMLIEVIRYNLEGKSVQFATFMSDGFLYFIAFVGLMLFCVIGGYLICREKTEHTLKTVLTIPISKTKYLTAKFVMLLVWIVALCFVAWLSFVIVGVISGVQGIDVYIAFDWMWRFLLGGVMINFILSPIIFLALSVGNIVAIMIVAVVIGFINVVASNDSLSMLFPYCSVAHIVSGEYINFPKYPLWLSLLLYVLLALIGYVASYIYFSKKDVT